MHELNRYNFNQKLIIGLLIASLVITFSALVLISLSPEKVTLYADLPESVPSTLTIDIAPQNLWEHYFNPQTIVLVSQPESGIVNIGTKPLGLKISTSEYLDQASINSANPNFEPETAELKAPLLPQEALALEIKVKLPEEAEGKRQIADGYIHFIDLDSKKELGAVHVIIINSNIAENTSESTRTKASCCEK